MKDYLDIEGASLPDTFKKLGYKSWSDPRLVSDFEDTFFCNGNILSSPQFIKPRPLRNNINPGGRWNSNTTWDAREAMVPGSVYDRQNRVRTHDPMTRISAHMGNVPGMSVPMSMVMNNQFNKKPPQSKSTHR